MNYSVYAGGIHALDANLDIDLTKTHWIDISHLRNNFEDMTNGGHWWELSFVKCY